MITAPFNFVPLSNEVFFPNWADKISHDIPMTDDENNLDSQSGEIDITIEAKSPIFIRDGKKKEKFCNHDGQYYIPSSSVKGMARSVLEILSFSKMSIDTYNDSTYSVRDLSKADNFYMTEMNKQKYGGWLKKVDNKYYIEDCGEVGRIKHDEIDKIFNIDFSSNFTRPKFDSRNKNLKIAKKKYLLVGDQSLVHNFSFERTDKGRKIYLYDPNSGKEGTIVFTGQPDARVEPEGEKAKGKGYEFIFFEKKGEYEVTKLMKNFKFAYFDGRDTEPKESKDWAFWKEKLENGEKIPVFFQKEGNIKHFGLSYLYKLPYNYSVSQGIPLNHKSDRLDLAQSIFGYIKDKNGLKGRIYFSHFLADSQTTKEKNTISEILGTPRASYYPIYVRQNGREYLTFMDSNFQIAGRKRYPIHEGHRVRKTQDTGNENVGTTFTPLSQGAVFHGKLRYHNLKKIELGAILSALTFHNTPNTFHNIGLAKSLGYGKIKVTIQNFSNLEEYLKEFEVAITQRILNWRNSATITELLTMATEQNNEGEAALEYMELTQFAKEKNHKNYLKMYSKLNGIKAVHVKSLISDSKMEEIESKHKEILENEKRLEEARNKQIQHNNDWDIAKESDNIANIENFVEKYPNSPFLDEAQKKLDYLNEQLLNAKEAKEKDEREKKLSGYLNESNPSKKRELLEKFLVAYETKYPDCEYVKKAQEELKTQTKPNTSKTISQDDLSKADNPNQFINTFKKYVAMHKDLSLQEKEKISLKGVIVEALSSVNNKAKRNFFKKSNIEKLFSKDEIQSLKDELNI